MSNRRDALERALGYLEVESFDNFNLAGDALASIGQELPLLRDLKASFTEALAHRGDADWKEYDDSFEALLREVRERLRRLLDQE